MFIIDKIKKLYGFVVDKIIDWKLDKIIAQYGEMEKNIKELLKLIDELQKEIDSLHIKNNQKNNQ